MNITLHDKSLEIRLTQAAKKALALGGGGGHDFGWAGTMMRPVFGSPKLAHSSPLAAW